MVHGAEQLGTFTVLDHILRELPDVQVVGDQVVGVADLPIRQLGPHFFVALAPRHDLSPDFRGQGIVGRCRLVPFGPL